MCGAIFKSRNREQSFSEAEEIRSRMEYLRNRLEKTRQLFDIETDPEKIEAIVYEEKAILIRLDHLIKNAKERNITISYCDRCDRCDWCDWCGRS
ncbi:MAG: DUF2508 family protein [Ruminiclostridium sp.]